MDNSKVMVALLACMVGGSSLFFIATRPCEPKAHAAMEMKDATVPVSQQIVEAKPADDVLHIPEIVIVSQKSPTKSARSMAGVSAKSGGVCDKHTPGVRISIEESGTVFYDCRK